MRSPLAKILAALLIGAGAVAATAAAETVGTQHGMTVEACAADPARLGLSRIVEIDTTGGPQFGGSHGADTDFLSEGEVVLTFDDGPMRAYTRMVLAALAEHCTKATFFMVGRMAAADPAMVKEVAAAGHTIATHTWSHKNLQLPGSRGRQEVEKGISAIARANGAPIAPFFRFPFLAGSQKVEEYLKGRNIAAMWIDVDSKDYLSRDPGIVHRRIMNGLKERRKGIILMHDIQPATARALKGLLDDLHENGFKVVHMIPKAPVETVAEFDGTAEKEIAAKEAERSGQPLADRGVVWTMPPGDSEKSGSKQARKTATAPAVEEEVLPWAFPSEPAAPARPKSRKSGLQKSDTPSWDLNIFNY